VALVTGASRGIGAATAEALRKAGARVVRVSRRLDPAEGYIDLPADLADADQATHLAEKVQRAAGVPEIVVSNAGGFLLAPLERTTIEQLDALLAINLRAAFAVARAFLPLQRSAGHGCYITLGSLADHVGFPENAAYAASKFAVRGLHETLVAEYRNTGVRLTLISPGPTDTDVWAPYDPDHREGFPPRARMLRPTDVADAVLFVATRPPHVAIDWLRLAPV
jgi:NAD(P)-dependent dehydrogenase (short-subunit alcohol dehydrogenase family)